VGQASGQQQQHCKKGKQIKVKNNPTKNGPANKIKLLMLADKDEDTEEGLSTAALIIWFLCSLQNYPLIGTSFLKEDLYLFLEIEESVDKEARFTPEQKALVMFIRVELV
jgi:hypothetical protein